MMISKIILSKLEPVTVIPCGIFKLTQSTKRLIINPNNPKLKKFNGKVNNFKTKPSVQFNRVNTTTKVTAAQIEATWKPESTELKIKITSTFVMKKTSPRSMFLEVYTSKIKCQTMVNYGL